jgi:hypothetical protein
VGYLVEAVRIIDDANERVLITHTRGVETFDSSGQRDAFCVTRGNAFENLITLDWIGFPFGGWTTSSSLLQEPYDSCQFPVLGRGILNLVPKNSPVPSVGMSQRRAQRGLGFRRVLRPQVQASLRRRAGKEFSHDGDTCRSFREMPNAFHVQSPVSPQRRD